MKVVQYLLGIFNRDTTLQVFQILQVYSQLHYQHLVRFRPIRTPNLVDILDLVLKEYTCELEETSPGRYQFSAILHRGEELLDHLEGQFFSMSIAGVGARGALPDPISTIVT